MSCDDQVKAILQDYVDYPPHQRQRGPHQRDNPFDLSAIRQINGFAPFWSADEWAHLHKVPEADGVGAFNPISCEGAIVPDVDWAPTSKRGRRTQYTADQITAMSDLIPSYDSLSEADRTRKVTDLLAPTGLFATLGPTKRRRLLRALGRRVKTARRASASKTAPTEGSAEGSVGREEDEEEDEELRPCVASVHAAGRAGP